MISDPAWHDHIRFVITNFHKEVSTELLKKGRFDQSKMLKQENWKLINEFKERPAYVPKNRKNIQDINQKQIFPDVIWLYKLEGTDIESITTHEIKTGDFDIIEVLLKYLYSRYSKSNIVSENSKFITICGSIESPLYIWGWHRYIVNQIPRLKDNPFNTLFRKGFIKVVPIEWIFPLVNNHILDSGMAITDKNIASDTENVSLVRYDYYRRLLPENKVISVPRTNQNLWKE